MSKFTAEKLKHGQGYSLTCWTENQCGGGWANALQNRIRIPRPTSREKERSAATLFQALVWIDKYRQHGDQDAPTILRRLLPKALERFIAKAEFAWLMDKFERATFNE